MIIMDNVCRTCLRIIGNGCSITSLHPSSTDSSSISIRQKLELCVPELTLDIVVDPTICGICASALVVAYQFRTKCIQTEKALFDCIQQRKKQNVNFTDLLGREDLICLARKNINEEHSYSATKRKSSVEGATSDTSDDEGSDDYKIEDQIQTIYFEDSHKKKSDVLTMTQEVEMITQSNLNNNFEIEKNREIKINAGAPPTERKSTRVKRTLQESAVTFMQSPNESVKLNKPIEFEETIPIKKLRKCAQPRLSKLSSITNKTKIVLSNVKATQYIEGNVNSTKKLFVVEKVGRETDVHSFESSEIENTQMFDISAKIDDYTNTNENFEIFHRQNYVEQSEIFPKTEENNTTILNPKKLHESSQLSRTEETEKVTKLKKGCIKSDQIIKSVKKEKEGSSQSNVVSVDLSEQKIKTLKENKNGSKKTENKNKIVKQVENVLQETIACNNEDLNTLNKSICDIIKKLKQHHDHDCGLTRVNKSFTVADGEKSGEKENKTKKSPTSLETSESTRQSRSRKRSELLKKRRKNKRKPLNLPRRQINIKRTCRSRALIASNIPKKKKILKLEIENNETAEELGFDNHIKVDVKVDEKRESPKEKTLNKFCTDNSKENFLEFLHKDKSNHYECALCEKVFSFKCHLDVHLQKHAQKFSCLICKKEFETKDHLKTHQTVHNAQWQCEICDRFLSSASALKRHVATHTGERPYKCEICSKRFAQDIQRIVHMRVHTGNRPFTCHVCNATFKQKSHLVGHMRIHTGEKPYKCELCPRTFRKPYALNIHKECHDKKPFQCKSCNYLVKEVQTFERHLYKHLIGSLPLKSDKPKDVVLSELQQDLKNVVTLRNIKQKDYQVGMFYCEVCNKGFSTNYNRIRHKFAHH